MSSSASPTGKKMVLNTLLETDHYSSLIKDLTCTKCTTYMRPPIHLCVDGHSICGKCYEKSYQCHVCSKEFALIRPMVLESLANKILFPCVNEGCSKHATLPVLDKHSPHCQYRIINCFMARVYGDCNWEGRAGQWMDHCFVDHKQKVTELPFITVQDKWDAKRTEPVLNYFLMRCFDKVFNVYQIYDKRGGRMMWTVLVNDEEAEKFYFEIDLFLPNLPSKRIVYRRPCKCERDADFLEHTQNVYIPVENVFSMLDEGEAMNFTVRIDCSWLSEEQESVNQADVAVRTSKGEIVKNYVTNKIRLRHSLVEGIHHERLSPKDERRRSSLFDFLNRKDTKMRKSISNLLYNVHA